MVFDPATFKPIDAPVEEFDPATFVPVGEETPAFDPATFQPIEDGVGELDQEFDPATFMVPDASAPDIGAVTGPEVPFDPATFVPVGAEAEQPVAQEAMPEGIRALEEKVRLKQDELYQPQDVTEEGFLGKTWEALKRGGARTKILEAIAESAIGGDDASEDHALEAIREYDKLSAKDPIEAENFLGRWWYSAMNSVGAGYLKSALRGLAVDAATGLALEAVTPPGVGTAVVLAKRARNVKRFARFAKTAMNTYQFGKSGVGVMTLEMADKDVDRSIRKPISVVGGLIYGLIENLGAVHELNPITKFAEGQLKSIVGDSMRKAVGKGILNYGTEVVKESFEEFLQEGVAATASNIAVQRQINSDIIEGIDKKVNNPEFRVQSGAEVIARGWDAFKQSIGPMMLMGAPGGAISTAGYVSGIDKARGDGEGDVSRDSEATTTPPAQKAEVVAPPAEEDIQSVERFKATGALDENVQAAPETEKTAQIREVVTALTGKRAVFVDGWEKANGAVDPSQPDAIFISTDAETPLLNVAIHEPIHQIFVEHNQQKAEGVEGRTDAEQLLDLMREVSPERYTQWQEKTQALRERQGEDALSGDAIAEEFIANFVGEQATNETFWNKLYDKSPRLLQRVVDIIDGVLQGMAQTLTPEMYQTEAVFKDAEALERARDIAIGVLGKRAEAVTGRATEQEAAPEVTQEAEVAEEAEVEQVAEEAEFDPATFAIEEEAAVEEEFSPETFMVEEESEVAPEPATEAPTEPPVPSEAALTEQAVEEEPTPEISALADRIAQAYKEKRQAETEPAKAAVQTADIVRGDGPRTYEVIKRHESTPEEQELGEEYMDIRDTQTGEVHENVLADDYTVVKKPKYSLKTDAKAKRDELQSRAKELGVSEFGSNKQIRNRIDKVESEIEVLRTSGSIIERIVAGMKIGAAQLENTERLRSTELSRRVGKMADIQKETSGLESFYKARAQLKGELPVSEGVAVGKYFSMDDRNELINAVNASNLTTLDKNVTSGAIISIMNGVPLRNFEIKLLGRVFGPEFAKAVKPLTLAGKIGNAMMQAAGLLRTLKTMLDLSAIGRQGAILGASHPILAARALRSMGRGLFSEAQYQQLHDAITSDPRYKLAEEAGLYIAPVNKEGVELSEREESFMSEWIDKIPVLGKLARVSERAFNGYLNALRADTFNKFVDKMGDTVTIEDYKKLANFINVATGRGGFDKNGQTTKKIEDAMPLMATVFFSPRWVLSRIQLPFSTLTPVRDADTGKLRWSKANTEAIKSSAAYFGLMLTALSMAAAAGADTEDDPRSSDSFKIKIGNTRIDLSAGMTQYWRFLAQMITKTRKSLASGKISPVQRESLMWRMIRSKLAPAPGSLLSAMFGKTFTGDEFVPVGDEDTAKALSSYMRKAGFSQKAALRVGQTGEITMRELLPLIIQQTIEGVQTDGMFGGLLAGGEFIGVSTSSFDAKKQKRRKGRKSELGETRFRTQLRSSGL